jgi:RNA polymerase sigma-70 factor (ECF subfamily)
MSIKSSEAPETMSKSQEIAIIQEVLDGNHEQYRYFVERYHRGLIQHLNNVMHDEQTAEDVAQEAFIKAYQKLSQYNSDYAFSTWLYKIANNIAYGHLKKSKPVEDLADFEEIIPDTKPSLPELAESHFTSEAVRKAVKGLPNSYQQVIAMYYWSNFNYEEIAQILDHPVGTIRTWLFRAKEQLRKDLYGQV